MLGLNIHLKSFKLNPGIINGNDKVRVSITTLPEQNKEAFVIEAKQMFCVHHFFTVNITEKTEKIIFVFRKKGFFEDPIIASKTISSSELPKSNENKNTEMKTYEIYEPLQNEQNRRKSNENRRVFGEMKIQFSLTTAFPTFDKKQSKSNYSKVNGYSKINSKKNGYNSIFADDYN